MVTLDRLVNVLGSSAVRLRHCPISRNTELSSVALHEATAERAVVHGDVLLAVDAESGDQAVHWALSARAAVVLVRAPDRDLPFVDTDVAVAVLLVAAARSGAPSSRSATSCAPPPSAPPHPSTKPHATPS